MTKKSAGRLQRDMLKKENEKHVAWDDLEEIYHACIHTMLDANEQLLKLFKTPGLAENIPDQKATANYVTALKRDLETFSSELVEIHSTHAGKKGRAEDEDFSECVQTFERYVHFEQRYQAVVTPTVAFLAEQAGLAADIISNKSNVNNVNVITDVVAKEVTDKTPPSQVVETVIV